MSKLKYFLLILFFLISADVQAFPDMIRHNYISCSACHVSPSGGGVLTAYGRQMSQAILSTWGSESEVNFLHSQKVQDSLPENFMVGGHLRSVQTHVESSKIKMGRFIRMQSALEFAYQRAKTTVVALVGKLEKDKVRPISERYYLMYQLDEQLTARVGRFLPTFGINTPQHVYPTRQTLGFMSGNERDQIEIFYQGESWSWALAQSQSTKSVDTEQATSGQLQYTLWDQHKFGLSFFRQYQQPVQMLSLHGVFGITQSLSYMTEFVQKIEKRSDVKTEGLYHFSKLNYEIYKGVYGFLYEDYSKSDIKLGSTLVNSYGLGFNFYPRPHLELELQWLKQRRVAQGSEYFDNAYLLMHYYF